MILLDTNILARMLDRGTPHHQPALDTLAALHSKNQSLAVCAQNLIELYCIATRSTNALRLTHGQAVRAITDAQSNFHMLPELPLHDTWMRLIAKYPVRGRPAFDLKLVAAAIAGGCEAILTFNVRDFQAVEEIYRTRPHMTQMGGGLPEGFPDGGNRAGTVAAATFLTPTAVAEGGLTAMFPAWAGPAKTGRDAGVPRRLPRGRKMCQMWPRAV